MPEPVVQRVVPGAPPPTPLSKTQKKKRKAKAKSAEPGDTPAVPETTSVVLAEKTPEPETALAPEPVTHSESQTSLLPEEEILLKPSPIVDLIHKRLKATTKKIVLNLIFSNTPHLILFFSSHGYLLTLLLTLKNLTMTRSALSRHFRVWKPFKKSWQK